MGLKFSQSLIRSRLARESEGLRKGIQGKGRSLFWWPRFESLMVTIGLRWPGSLCVAIHIVHDSTSAFAPNRHTSCAPYIYAYIT